MATLRLLGRLRLCLLLVLAIVVVASALYLARSCRGDAVDISACEGREASLMQVMEAQKIGEWEFLSIEDEEMVDTMRRGILGDDYLVRIYYGTLRLGFDMSEAGDDWITDDKGALSVVLPPVRLLDDSFVDEARTKSFFESGSWSDRDRAEMYHRAYAKMLSRCLTEANIKYAEDNAIKQFRHILNAIGYTDVRISFAEAGDVETAAHDGR